LSVTATIAILGVKIFAPVAVLGRRPDWIPQRKKVKAVKRRRLM
jgi:hypothetical protein